MDITIASPSAERMVRNWRVVDDWQGETLSDHRYIEDHRYTVILGHARRSLIRPPTGGGGRQEMGPHKAGPGEAGGFTPGDLVGSPARGDREECG